MRFAFIALILMLVSFGIRAEDSAAECPIEKEGVGWSRACFESIGQTRQVKPEFRDRIVVNEKGFETILVAEPLELVAVDREGVVILPGIAHTGDFDYPTAESGIGRFNSAGKCGYFQSDSLKIVIPAVYEACHPFRDGRAVACRDCVAYCIGQECLSTHFVGGNGYELDVKGNVVREFMPPTLENACGKVGVAEVGKLHDTIPMLVCNTRPARRIRR
jgi:hypothetical protein